MAKALAGHELPVVGETTDDQVARWLLSAAEFRAAAETYMQTLGEVRARISHFQLPVLSDGKEQP